MREKKDNFNHCNSVNNIKVVFYTAMNIYNIHLKMQLKTTKTKAATAALAGMVIIHA